MSDVNKNAHENTDENLICARFARITINGTSKTIAVPPKACEILGLDFEKDNRDNQVFMIVRKANDGIIINLKKRDSRIAES